MSIIIIIYKFSFFSIADHSLYSLKYLLKDLSKERKILSDDKAFKTVLKQLLELLKE